MKASWNGKIIADAQKDQLVFIEGNLYFPPETVDKTYLENSDLTTECFWKGTASYYSLVDGDTRAENLAWYYAQPKEGSEQKVGKPFKDFIAFYPQVTLEE